MPRPLVTSVQIGRGQHEGGWTVVVWDSLVNDMSMLIAIEWQHRTVGGLMGVSRGAALFQTARKCEM